MTACAAPFDLGGPEVFTYHEMIQRIATLRGRNPRIVEVPVLSPRLSSYLGSTEVAEHRHELLTSSGPG